MIQKRDIEKLRLLLPHWIEHNFEHANEFRTWASKASIARNELLMAAEYFEKAGYVLEVGLEKLGGPIEKEASQGKSHSK
jgi:hypothetical protein